MGVHLATRRRMLARYGRPMILQRHNPPSGAAPADLTLQGFMYPFAAEKIAAPIRQGDANAAILNDEIAAAGWPGPPGNGDWLVVDGVSYQIVGADPLYDGATLIGFNMWIRGGEP